MSLYLVVVNSYTERFIRTTQEKEVNLTDYLDFSDTYARIGQFIGQFYRHKRIHFALGWSYANFAQTPTGEGDSTTIST